MLYKHLPQDEIVISRRTKLRTMSNSMSIEYEDIKPTQSTDCVLETETQDNFPDTQETVCNYDIFYSDDPTSDDDDPCDMAECTGCSFLHLEVTGGQPRLCASCRYYAQYEYDCW